MSELSPLLGENVPEGLRKTVQVAKELQLVKDPRETTVDG